MNGVMSNSDSIWNPVDDASVVHSLRGKELWSIEHHVEGEKRSDRVPNRNRSAEYCNDTD